MSTYSSKSERRKGKASSTLFILGGILVALQLMLPSLALAAPARAASYQFGQSQALDQAGVAVVRLVVSYASSAQKQPTPSVPTGAGGVAECSGLGVLVKSWPARSGSDQNSWVLTDGALVNPAAPSCLPGSPPQALSSIQVYANTTYTSTSAAPLLLGTFHAPIAASTFLCRISPASCSVDAVLFAFHSDALLPFVSPTTLDADKPTGIELVNATSSLPPSSTIVGSQPQQVLQYLDLASAPANGTSSQNELGMPIVNSTGQLTSLHLQNVNGMAALNAAKLAAFVNQIVAPALSNPVQVNWQKGVTAYWAGQYRLAQTAFQQAHNANPTFQAAQAFASLAAFKAGRIGTSPTAKSSPTAATLFGIPRSILTLVGLIVSVVVLILLFLLVSLRFGRARARRRELAHFKADQAEAERRADLELKRQQETGADVGARFLAPNGVPVGTQTARELPCPNCGEIVQADAIYCSNCRYLLSPSASGLHLKAKPPASAVEGAKSAMSSSVSSLSSAPAIPGPAAISPVPSLVPASSISDQPTIEMSPGRSENGQIDAETTLPYPFQQFQGRNLSLAVGYRSDVGIKRQHKPNEDSLFAMQGARTYDSQPQPFGLFVVADGMGGHASGEDASRLAIQTIIDFVLPKVSASTEANDEAFLNLMSEGVQRANAAVHQRNMDERADSGTTMTAALIVGATAYITNVGDSRTYLYREPEGLMKITRDHSVVASLVDAGIIKPDDIYTHPKRNQIYRSLGEKPFVEVDAFRVPLQPGDKLLLCSDGLWDMVRDPDIARLMSNPVPDPAQTGNALIQAALEGGGEDNVSVIVVQINEETQRTGITGVQLLAKPDTVTLPDVQM